MFSKKCLNFLQCPLLRFNYKFIKKNEKYT